MRYFKSFAIKESLLNSDSAIFLPIINQINNERVGKKFPTPRIQTIIAMNFLTPCNKVTDNQWLNSDILFYQAVEGFFICPDNLILLLVPIGN